MNKNEAIKILKEALEWYANPNNMAEIQHGIWSHWMKYQFSKCLSSLGERIIIKGLVERWTKQMNTPYNELSEEEKESDRKVVDEFGLRNKAVGALFLTKNINEEESLKDKLESFCREIGCTGVSPNCPANPYCGIVRKVFDEGELDSIRKESV